MLIQCTGVLMYVNDGIVYLMVTDMACMYDM